MTLFSTRNKLRCAYCGAEKPTSSYFVNDRYAQCLQRALAEYPQCDVIAMGGERCKHVVGHKPPHYFYGEP